MTAQMRQFIMFGCVLAIASSVRLSMLQAQISPPVTLNSIVEQVITRNPLIQSARRGVDAKRSLIRPATTLPEPTVSFQTMGNFFLPTLQKGDRSSGRNFIFTQEIPFPGKLRLQGRMALTDADAEWWSYEQLRRQIVAEVKVTYYEHWLISKSQEIVNKDKDLLEKFAQIAEAKYSVGEGIQQDVIKAQVEVSKLLDRSVVLQQRESLSMAQINSLLYRPPETPLGRLADVEESSLDMSIEELYRLAVKNSPVLKMQERAIDRNEFGVQLARKNFYPDFEVGFTYVNRSAMPEMFGLMVGAKIPFYFWRKQSPELDAAAATLSSARKKYDWLHSRLYFELKDVYLSATTSKKLLDLYGKGIIPQSTLSLESATSGYQVGRVDFLTLLDNLVTLLDYELKYYEVLADYQKALARLEAMVGVELTQ
ncbi:MAG: TolC family protein [Acidobacteria bacterium]|nr:TolC family protein [Acidobacteriota bacterium]